MADSRLSFYDAQMDDDAMLGPDYAERKWHGKPKPSPYRQELREFCASFDEIVRQHARND